MILKVYEKEIHIIPDQDIDRAFIENTLGLTKKDPVIECRRVDQTGLERGTVLVIRKTESEES